MPLAFVRRKVIMSVRLTVAARAGCVATVIDD